MSEYTIANEAVLTCTTTSVVTSSDVIPLFSQTDGRLRGTKPSGLSGAIFYQPVTTSTNTSTTTLLPNQGLIIITSASSAQFFLSTPTGNGQSVTIFNTSSTSTGTYITTNSTASCNFQSTGGIQSTSIGFSKTGAYADIISNGANWLVVGLSASGVQCT